MYDIGLLITSLHIFYFNENKTCKENCTIFMICKIDAVHQNSISISAILKGVVIAIVALKQPKKSKGDIE